MTEQEFIQDIQRMMIESLNIKYADFVPEKVQLEEQAKQTLATLAQKPELMNSIAEEIKNWSYQQAASFQYTKTPINARSFLSLIGVRNFTNERVKVFEQELVEQYNQTR